MSDTGYEASLGKFLGEMVVLDTQGPMLYIGVLESISTHYLTLREADVHDTNDSRATKDLYLAEARELGVRANRTRVMVAVGMVISVSLLGDVKG